MRNLELACVCLALLAGCGSKGVDLRKEVEASEWFKAPIRVGSRIGPDPAGPGQQLLGGEIPSGCIAARLLDRGILTVKAAANEPWWVFEMTRGQGAGDYIGFDVGTREIKSVRKRERWTDGAKRYEAATITYVIRDSGMLSSAGKTYGPLEIRLVYEFDPAVGTWHLSDQSPQRPDQTGQTLEEMRTVFAETTATCSRDALREALDDAKQVSFAGVERDLANAGTIARGPAPNIFLSRNAGFALYLGTQDIPEFRSMRVGQIAPAAEARCQALSAGGRTNWRLGTFAAMDAVTTNHVQDWIRFPIDRPDKAMWLPFYSSIGEEGVLMPTADQPDQSWGPFSGIWVNREGRMDESKLVMDFQYRRKAFRLFCIASL